MKKLGIFVLIITITIFIGFQHSEATKKDYYRTYEIIKITENGLTLQDINSNIITADKDPNNYKVGYSVRYDKIRKRLRLNRWQDYEVVATSGNIITLRHKTGDTITVEKNYTDKYNVGDQVRYDSVDNKLQLHENPKQ